MHLGGNNTPDRERLAQIVEDNRRQNSQVHFAIPEPPTEEDIMLSSPPLTPLDPNQFNTPRTSARDRQSTLSGMMANLDVKTDGEETEEEDTGKKRKIAAKVGVRMRANQGIVDLFVVNPPVFKSNGTNFALFAMHLPSNYTEVDALISKNGRRCELTITKPQELMIPRIVALDRPGNYNTNTALHQAIIDWKESQQDDSNADIKKTIVLDLPFQAKPHFGTNLIVQGGYINSMLVLPSGDRVRQLVLVFEEKEDNTFTKERAVAVNLDFSVSTHPPNRHYHASTAAASSARTTPVRNVQSPALRPGGHIHNSANSSSSTATFATPKTGATPPASLTPQLSTGNASRNVSFASPLFGVGVGYASANNADNGGAAAAVNERFLSNRVAEDSIVGKKREYANTINPNQKMGSNDSFENEESPSKYYKVGNDYDNMSFMTLLNQYESEKENGEDDMSSIQTDDPDL